MKEIIKVSGKKGAHVFLSRAGVVFLGFGIAFVFLSGVYAGPSDKKPLTSSRLEKTQGLPVAIPVSCPDPIVGEFLTYEVRWLGMSIGKITTCVKGVTQFKGRSVYQIEVQANTSSFFSLLYQVRDRFISYMDTENLSSLRYEEHRREGRFKKDAVTEFDYSKGKAYSRNLLSAKEKTWEIPRFCHDVLSAIYYFRTLPLEKERVNFWVTSNGEMYDLVIDVRKPEALRMGRLGSFSAFFVDAVRVRKGQLGKKGRVYGYFSADRDRVPLLAVVRAPLFRRVVIRLSKIQYPEKPEGGRANTGKDKITLQDR
jgi:hypothetical protein